MYTFRCEVEDTEQGKMCTWRIFLNDTEWVCDVGGHDHAEELTTILNGVSSQSARIEELEAWKREASDELFKAGAKYGTALTRIEELTKAVQEAADTFESLKARIDGPAYKIVCRASERMDAALPPTPTNGKADPHADGDYSKMCSNPHCRCQS